MKEQLEHFLPLLPLKNVVILPKSILPIIVGRKSSVEAVEYALSHNKEIFITAQKHPDVEHPNEKDVYDYGTRSTILQVMRMQKGTLKILVEGICRSKILSFDQSDEFINVSCQDLPTTSLEKTVELEAIWRNLKSLYTVYAKLNSKMPLDLMSPAKTVEDMDNIADTIAVHINLSFDERQELLEITDLKERLLNSLILYKKKLKF